ncbi:MAG TPA: MASE3 domain-containing protein [Bryobacteraceae bacterium]|nr:MASE3 domain-containing protein [Bryobacteraceae bacterium]
MSNKADQHSGAILTGALVAALALAAYANFLLFHAVVEFFTVAVAWSIFFLAWNARRNLDNHALLAIGVGSLFMGLADALHALAYRGMGVFPSHDANLPTQLWIVARYVQAATLLSAPFFVRRKLPAGPVIVVSAAVTAFLLGSVFFGVFPACYVEGFGLTNFKVVSEYVVIAAFVAAIALVINRRKEFEPSVRRQITTSLVLTVAAELAFTVYTDVYGLANAAGHLLRFVSFTFLYRAILVTGIRRPYDLLYRNLARSEEALRQSDERYRAFVANTSEGIFRLEMRRPLPVDIPEADQIARLLSDAYIAECNDAYARMQGGEPVPAGSSPSAPLPSMALLRDFVRSGYRMTEFETCVSGQRCLAGSFAGVIENGVLVRAWGVLRDVTERNRATEERERLIKELKKALAEVQTLSGLLPMCAGCKKIRDDKGYWTQVESYLERHARVQFSHGLCPDCLVSLYPDFFPKSE